MSRIVVTAGNLAEKLPKDSHVAIYLGHERDPRHEDPASASALPAVTRYWSNVAFLDDGQLLHDAHKLAGIPAVPINGRLDISEPSDVAFQLALA